MVLKTKRAALGAARFVLAVSLDLFSGEIFAGFAAGSR
jgi:hypothetical protein